MIEWSLSATNYLWNMKLHISRIVWSEWHLRCLQKDWKLLTCTKVVKTLIFLLILTIWPISLTGTHLALEPTTLLWLIDMSVLKAPQLRICSSASKWWLVSSDHSCKRICLKRTHCTRSRCNIDQSSMISSTKPNTFTSVHPRVQSIFKKKSWARLHSESETS